MSMDDDEEPSITERLNRGNAMPNAKVDKLQRTAMAKGKLLNETKLASLKQRMDSSSTATNTPADQAAKLAAAQNEGHTEGGFGTKTLEQMREEEMQTAQDQPTSDTLIQDAKRVEASRTDSQEYQQDMG